MTLRCLKRSLAILGVKLKICIYFIKLTIYIWNTIITNGEVLSDSVMLKTEMGCLGQNIKILHILHKIAYFDLEHPNNRWGGSK